MDDLTPEELADFAAQPRELQLALLDLVLSPALTEDGRATDADLARVIGVSVRQVRDYRAATLAKMRRRAHSLDSLPDPTTHPNP